MSNIVNASLDLTKIEKSKIIKGKKGSYINMTMFINDENDQFGNNASVIISQTKEEREAKTPRVYLGNDNYTNKFGQKRLTCKTDYLGNYVCN